MRRAHRCSASGPVFAGRAARPLTKPPPPGAATQPPATELAVTAVPGRSRAPRRADPPPSCCAPPALSRRRTALPGRRPRRKTPRAPALPDPAQQGAVERVAVTGCAGAARCTLTRQLANRNGLPLMETDRLGQRARSATYPPSPRCCAAALDPGWPAVLRLRTGLLCRDTVAFPDNPKALVLWRTVRVEVLRHRVGAHRPHGLPTSRNREHPLRYAWTSHADRHREGLALMAQPDLAHTQALRFTHPP
jgi:hypothetical protein